MKLPANYKLSSPATRRRIRMEYTRIQGGKCYYCGGDLDKPHIRKEGEGRINKRLFPWGFFDRPVHLHHCHKTDMTIGSVHSRCNAVLWQYHRE